MFLVSCLGRLRAREAEDEAEEKLGTWMLSHLLQNERIYLASRTGEDLRRFEEAVSVRYLSTPSRSSINQEINRESFLSSSTWLVTEYFRKKIGWKEVKAKERTKR